LNRGIETLASVEGCRTLIPSAPALADEIPDPAGPFELEGRGLTSNSAPPRT
jgi:hypothetical protein